MCVCSCYVGDGTEAAVDGIHVRVDVGTRDCEPDARGEEHKEEGGGGRSPAGQSPRPPAGGGGES